MMKSLSQQLKDRSKKRFALLIDPDKYNDKSLDELIRLIKLYPPDLLLVGGSLLMSPIDMTITVLKLKTSVPVFIFPGNVLQLSDRADGILLLSLISGRNADFLIGNQVLAAPHIKRSGIEVIPTGYMLIENGKSTSVEYMSNTRPLPAGKTDIAVSTAMAGEMLGLKVIYLEAGSGAKHTVGVEMIEQIRKNISLPLIVGGGIKSIEDARAVYSAGADLIVVGTAVEKNPETIKEFVELREELNT